MKKLIIFLVVGLVLGAGLAGGGVYFMVQSGTIKAPEEVVEPAFELKDGKRFTLEKVQIPLAQTGSKTSLENCMNNCEKSLSYILRNSRKLYYKSN